MKTIRTAEDSDLGALIDDLMKIRERYGNLVIYGYRLQINTDPDTYEKTFHFETYIPAPE